MPSHLHGLNIVHPVQSDLDSQDLLAGPFPDLSLWTHLPFESEDSPSSALPNDEKYGKVMEEEDVDGRAVKATAMHDGHVNVVTGTNVGDDKQQQQSSQSAMQPQLDFSTLLSAFGLDPMALAQQLQPVQQSSPSLAQLLALHSNNSVNPMSYYPQPTPPVASDQSQTNSSRPSVSSEDASAPSLPPAKRARTRKSSMSTSDSPTDASPDPSVTPLSASEDKRRRNTAASARFRLKKKEREVALETKAKELELKVSELERECEGLRRENGWLKGLVVGVTGAAQTNSAVQNTTAMAGVKRSREAEAV